MYQMIIDSCKEEIGTVLKVFIYIYIDIKFNIYIFNKKKNQKKYIIYFRYHFST